ncbi:retrovirus-related pol polyprotein from transposon TNT 1-94 [Tanacetum coccineum]
MLDVRTRQILDSKGAIPTKTAANVKVTIQEMAEYSQKWHNETSLKAKNIETSDVLAAIQAQLNSIGREIKKINEKVYAAQVGCELCKGPHYTKDCSLKEEGKTLEEAYYILFGVPYQPGGQYRAARQDSTSETTEILHSQYDTLFSETVLFPNQLHGYCCDDWKEVREVKILETYDHALPKKQKDLRSFTLPCFIHNVCFDKGLVDLGASISVMPFSTYTNLGLGDLAHTRLTIELADRTIKHPKGIAENVLVRIGKFIFLTDFIILDIPEDGDFIREAVDESFDPHYRNDIELNDLDVPLEPKIDQDDNFEPTLDFVNEPTYKSYKGDHEGKNLARTSIDIPIFVGNFAIILGFSIIDDMGITSGVVFGMPFCKKFVSCQKIMNRFAHEDEYERMDDKE